MLLSFLIQCTSDVSVRCYLLPSALVRSYYSSSTRLRAIDASLRTVTSTRRRRWFSNSVDISFFFTFQIDYWMCVDVTSGVWTTNHDHTILVSVRCGSEKQVHPRATAPAASEAMHDSTSSRLIRLDASLSAFICLLDMHFPRDCRSPAPASTYSYSTLYFIRLALCKLHPRHIHGSGKLSSGRNTFYFWVSREFTSNQ